MRTSNLKFINATIFVFTFIISGLFFNTQGVFGADPDIIPPTVIASDPVDNSTNVSVGVKPKITFSEPLNPTSIDNTNIQLRNYAELASDSTSVPATLVLSEGDTVVTFNTLSNLDYSKKYYFFIGSGVQDVAGNPFAANTWYHADRDNHEFTTESSPLTLNSIAITIPPTKLSYTVGDALDITGLTVMGTYSDATTKIEIVTLADVTGFSSTVATPVQTLTITLGSITTTYDVSISDASTTPDTIATTVDNTSSGSYVQPTVEVLTLPKTIACAPLSGHIYDIYTGELCTNDTSIPVVEETKIETPVVSILNPVKQVEEISPKTDEPIEKIQKEEDSELSGREVLINNLSASAGKIGKVFKGPMILWIILILIAILLGGGYGIYSLLKKDKNTDEIKKVEPIIPVNKIPVQETLPINNLARENSLEKK